jgi:hypothetical protein
MNMDFYYENDIVDVDFHADSESALRFDKEHVLFDIFLKKAILSVQSRYSVGTVSVQCG